MTGCALATSLRRRALVALAALGIALVATTVPAQAPGEDDRVPDEILVELIPSASIDAVAPRYELTVLEGVPRWNLWRTRVATGASVDATVDAMNQDPEIANAEPHRRIETPEGVQETIADLDILGNSLAFRTQSAAATVRADQAHARYTGAGITVAVVDTSTSLTHPEFATRMLGAGADFAGGTGNAALQDNGLDDDLDGLVDESSNHATHVIGLINLAAPDADIIAIRALEEDGKGTAFAVANAILEAVRRQADVINLSFTLSFYSRTIERAIEDAIDAGVVVVAAAGNRGREQVEFPASHPDVIAVAGVDDSNVRSVFSNYGPEIDISAPARNLLSTYLDDAYAHWSGTSFATPLVSGAAALVLQKYPCLSPPEVRAALRDTAAPDANPPELAGKMGAGVLDLDALTARLSPLRCSLRVRKTARGTVFTWSPVLGALRYDLVRGYLDDIVFVNEVVDLGGLTCVVDDTTATDNDANPETTVPAPGIALFYLFRDDAPDPQGGGFGVDSDGHPRQADPAGCAP